MESDILIFFLSQLSHYAYPNMGKVIMTMMLMLQFSSDDHLFQPFKVASGRTCGIEFVTLILYLFEIVISNLNTNNTKRAHSQSVSEVLFCEHVCHLEEMHIIGFNYIPLSY